MNERKIRRTEITIETHSVTIIRFKGNSSIAHCERCQKPVAALPIEKFTELLRLDLMEVCRRVQTGELHLTETGRSVALICGGSLNN